MSDEPSDSALLVRVREAIEARPGTELVEVRGALPDEIHVVVREEGRDHLAAYRIVSQPEIDSHEERLRWVYLGDAA